MEIYIQSCGIASDQDFHWRQIIGDGWEKQEEKVPPNFFSQKAKNTKGEVKEVKFFFKPRETSLLFLEDEDKFILLITELKADDRTKIYGRKVRNFIVIISENEKLLKGIFNYVKYNWKEFEKEIDTHIDFDAKNGFIVKKFGELIKYLEGLENENKGSQSEISKEIENVEELYIIPSEEEKTRKKSSNFLILVGILSVVLFLIITILIVTNNQKKQESSSTQLIQEETCQTMINWHSPCLYLTN